MRVQVAVKKCEEGKFCDWGRFAFQVVKRSRRIPEPVAGVKWCRLPTQYFDRAVNDACGTAPMMGIFSRDAVPALNQALNSTPDFSQIADQYRPGPCLSEPAHNPFELKPLSAQASRDWLCFAPD